MYKIAVTILFIIYTLVLLLALQGVGEDKACKNCKCLETYEQMRKAL